MEMFEYLFEAHHSVSFHPVKLYIVMETIVTAFQKMLNFFRYTIFFYWPLQIRYININIYKKKILITCNK